MDYLCIIQRSAWQRGPRDSNINSRRALSSGVMTCATVGLKLGITISWSDCVFPITCTILVHLFETVSVQSGLLHSHWPISFQTFCKTLGFFSSILFCIFFVGKLASPPCGVFPVVKTRSEQEIEMSVTDSHIRIWCRKVRVSRNGFEMPSRCVTLRDQKYSFQYCRRHKAINS